MTRMEEPNHNPSASRTPRYVKIMSKMPNNKSTSNSVNIATFNARSIYETKYMYQILFSFKIHVHEINNFTESSSIHFLAVTESWLGPSIPDARVELPNFKAPFRRDRNENGGGVSIYLSKNISGKRRKDLEHSDLELMWIEINSFSHRPLLLGC